LKVKRQPPAPAYPARARTNGIEGVVVIDLTVDATGAPVRAAALSGPAELLMTALRFALQWEFEPAILNGQPQPARFKLTMPFSLSTHGLPSPMPKRRP
jgi:protein TonB